MKLQVNFVKRFSKYFLDRFVRSRRLKFDILSSFLALQLITAISIFSYTFVNNSKELLDISNHLMEDVSDSEITSIIDSCNEVMNSTELASFLVKDPAKIDINNKDLIQYMVGHVRNFFLVDTIVVGCELGTYLQLTQVRTGQTYKVNTSKLLPKKIKYLLQFGQRSENKASETCVYLDDLGNEIDREDIPEIYVTYFVKKRPWYIQAMQTNDKCWSDIFVSSFTLTSSVACSIPLVSQSGEIFGVICSGVSLENLATTIATKSVKGTTMILNKKGEIVAHPTEKKSARIVNNEVKLVHVNDLNDKTAAEAAGIRMKDPNKDRFIFSFNGDEYIVMFKNIEKLFLGWEFLLLVKTEEFLGRVKITQRNTLIMCLVILFLSIFLIAYMARRIAAPINNLSEQADRITSFDLDNVNEVKSGIKEIQTMQNSITRMRKSMISFSKFVPKNLVKKLIDKGIEVKVGGTKKQLTIFFSDIANFTTISETYPAEKLVTHLSEYFEEMTSILTDNSGTIDKYIGDAIMAFWGSPGHDVNHSVHCCLSALLCQRRLLDLNRKWSYEKKPQLLTRIGIHTGEVIVGNIGSSERMNYSVIGDAVNLAARLEGTNKIYGTKIIVSDITVKHLHEHAVVRPLDIVAVKGKNEGVLIYELVALKNSDPLVLPTDDQLTFCDDFSKAFRFYLEQRWDEAIETFKSLEIAFGKDEPCTMYISRCEEFKISPPPPGWTGVYHLKSK